MPLACTQLLPWLATAMCAAFPVGKAEAACIGDCDGNGQVEIDEVVKGVNVLLGKASLDTCYRADVNCDGAVTVDEVISAIDGALTVCRYPSADTAQFHFSVRERVDSIGHGEPQIMLGVSTTEIFPCCCYGIDNRVQVEGQVITVSLGPVLPPQGVCLDVLAPAGFTAPLSLSNGTYELELASPGGVDRYSVSVSDKFVQLRTHQANFSQPEDCVTPRVPRFAIVANCFRYHYGDEDPSTAIDELCPLFFADVEAIAQPLAEGDGTTVGGYCGPDDFAAGTCRLYRYTGDAVALQQVIGHSERYNLPHGYRASDGRPLYHALIDTWLGQTFFLDSSR